MVNKFLAEQIVGKADKICRKRGIRMTKTRSLVLRLMCEMGKVKAYALLYELQKSMRSAAPPTVYRALEFLVKQGFVHRLDASNSFIVCESLSEDPHTAYFLECLKCQDVVEVPDDDIRNKLKKSANEQKFQLEREVIELLGVCNKCQDSELPVTA